MSPAEHLAYFLKLAARPFDRNRTPAEGLPVAPEALWRDVTPLPEDHQRNEFQLPPVRNDFSTDFSDEPTKEIRR